MTVRCEPRTVKRVAPEGELNCRLCRFNSYYQKRFQAFQQFMWVCVAGETQVLQERSVTKRGRPSTRTDAKKPPAMQSVTIKMSENATHGESMEIGQRPRRVRKRPSKFLDYIPPAENKPRGEEVR